MEAQVGNLLFRLILIVQSNAKLLWESYERMKQAGKTFEMLNIAYGVYPFTSFYNHSCDQNVVYAFHKDTVVCHASQPIDAGQQVTYELLFLNYRIFVSELKP